MRNKRLTAGEAYRRHVAHGGASSAERGVDRTRAARTVVQAPPRKRRPFTVVGRVLTALSSAVVLLVAGTAWAESTHFANGFFSSNALGNGPKSTNGAENILLMGLDTRKDRNGNDLPKAILDQLHAGDGDEGGYNTNTLILVHISADRKSVVAFSIPRDDFVTMDDLDVDQAKIKEAYGRKKFATETELQNEGVTDPSELEQRGREAGRMQTIETVRDLTGVPIDRFAEVSLVGFYDIAKALGGVKVCLNDDVNDSEYSGARFTKGVHVLNASQSLAFVRQRHGLDNGDLDRTHRQQAFLLSVLHQMQSTGTLTDVSKLDALIDVLQRDVVLSSGWNLLDWVQDMSTATNPQISFQTLPVVRYDTVNGQDVNIVDPDAIRDQVQVAFGLKAPTPSTTPSDSSDSSDASTSSSTDASASADALANASGPTPDQGQPVTNVDGIPCVN